MSEDAFRASEFSGKDDGGQDAPFNFSLLFYIGLNKLIEQKDEAYMRNDVQAWYKTIRVIFNRISFKLKDFELDIIKKKLSEAKAKIVVNDDCSSELHEADLLIIKYMDQYKMIFPRIDKNVGLNKVRNRYQLPEAKK
jgi:hypothetical protein